MTQALRGERLRWGKKRYPALVLLAICGSFGGGV